VFIAPTTPKGIKLISRPSYELIAQAGTSVRLSSSSRFDENDATHDFDNVFVPWENVFIFPRHQESQGFFPIAQVLQICSLQGATRFTTKLEFPLASSFVWRIERDDRLRGVQEKTREKLLRMCNDDALVRDACLSPDPAANGYVAPAHRPLWAYRVGSRRTIYRGSRADPTGRSWRADPNSVQRGDFKQSELRPFIDLYYKGAGMDAEQRVKLSKLGGMRSAANLAGGTNINEALCGQLAAIRTFQLSHAFEMPATLVRPSCPPAKIRCRSHPTQACQLHPLFSVHSRAFCSTGR